ncbi:hypothetical protein ElyMa_003748500 [Elysia marginata]|uniref:Uncharacterized protein n=1 Tax=Elysia marginata TaxID=1093978 RepID=A0AAV4F7V7_9GAST|nr:hypothetical protein ElyMa_003748500 [Elysia marginata]
MCVNSFSQGLNVDLPKAGLEPRTSRSESRASTTTPRRHIYLDPGATITAPLCIQRSNVSVITRSETAEFSEEGREGCACV